jgi:hypothetical protein
MTKSKWWRARAARRFDSIEVREVPPTFAICHWSFVIAFGGSQFAAK